MHHCLAMANHHCESTMVQFHFLIDHQVRAQAQPWGISSQNYYLHEGRPAKLASWTENEKQIHSSSTTTTTRKIHHKRKKAP
jgi:hypothetical protein